MKKVSIVAILAFVAFCTVNCGNPQKTEAAPAPENPVSANSEDEAPPGEDPLPEDRFQATVIDRYDVKVELTDAWFVYPSGSLFGGNGDPSTTLELFYGAGTLELEATQVATLEFYRVENRDLVGVTVHLREGKKKIDAKIKKDAEIHGRMGVGKFKIRFRDVKKLEIQPKR